jgi:chromosome partitioning protein
MCGRMPSPRLKPRLIRPIVITVAGQKGGIGKTSVAIALALVWHMEGWRVLLIDCDDPKQRSARTWSEVAAERGNDVPTVVLVGDDLKVQLPRLARGFDIVIVDTPGHLTGRVAYALGQSNLALLPCNGDGLEVWGMSMATAPAVLDVQQVARKLDACIVVTRERKDTSTGRRVRTTLARTGLPVLNTYLEQRKPYAHSINIGKGPTTYKPRGKHALEVHALAIELEKRLGFYRSRRRPAPPVAARKTVEPRGRRKAPATRRKR